MAVRECKNLRDKCLKNQTNKKTKQPFFLLGQEEEKSLFGPWVASHVEQQEPKVYYHHQKAWLLKTSSSTLRSFLSTKLHNDWSEKPKSAITVGLTQSTYI